MIPVLTKHWCTTEMAQGLGAKAKMVFKGMQKPTDEEEGEDVGGLDDDSFDDVDDDDDDDDDDSDEDSDEDSDFDNFFGMSDEGAIWDPERMPKEVKDALAKQFTKEKMHAPMKEGASAYTKWLDENRNYLPEEEKATHEETCEMYQKIADIFNDQQDTDSDDIKRQNAVDVYALMLKATQNGKPPTSVAQAMGNAGSGITSMESFGNLDDMDDCVIS